MSVRQLWELQCLEQAIDAAEQALARDRAGIGESQALLAARARLAQARAELAALGKEQRTAEWALSDLGARMTATKDSLYSGRIRNPKELQSLQQEFDALKAQCQPLEEQALCLMEQAEAIQAKISRLEGELGATEAKWRQEQKALGVEIGELENRLGELRTKREKFIQTVPADELGLFSQLKGIRGLAVSRVEQGTCGRCRLTLSSAEIQRARAGVLIQCSSCGRLLFFD